MGENVPESEELVVETGKTVEGRLERAHKLRQWSVPHRPRKLKNIWIGISYSTWKLLDLRYIILGQNRPNKRRSKLFRTGSNTEPGIGVHSPRLGNRILHTVTRCILRLRVPIRIQLNNRQIQCRNISAFSNCIDQIIYRGPINIDFRHHTDGLGLFSRKSIKLWCQKVFEPQTLCSKNAK